MNNSRKNKPFGGHCPYCGVPLYPSYTAYEPNDLGVHPELDKIPICSDCAFSKGSLSTEQFRLRLQGFELSLLTLTNYRTAKRFGLVKFIEEPVVFYYEKEDSQK